MCLLYALWALAAKDSEKYQQHHEIFYKRARQYAYRDEMNVSFPALTTLEQF
jgi:hypothetical protein